MRGTCLSDEGVPIEEASNSRMWMVATVEFGDGEAREANLNASATGLLQEDEFKDGRTEVVCSMLHHSRTKKRQRA